jgi:putative nucleotidyltransferase with HDIG domain
MPWKPKNKINLKTDTTVKFLLALVTVVLITIMFPKYETIEADYSVGSIWGKDDLIAPFSFPIYKSDAQYQKDVNTVKEKVLPVFELNKNPAGHVNNWLDSVNILLNNVKKVLDYENELNKEKSLPEERRITSQQTLNSMKEELNLPLTPDEWESLYALAWGALSNQGSTWETFRKLVVQSLNQAYEKHIIDVPRSRFKTDKISYIKNKLEENIDMDDVSDLGEVRHLARTNFKNNFKDDTLVTSAVKLTMMFVVPDLKFDKEETDKVINAVVETVPKTVGIVKENERIISKHEPITELAKLKLESYRKIRNEQMGSRDYYMQQVGRLLFVIMMVLLLGMFLYKMRRSVYKDNSKLLLISTLILLECLFAYLSFNIKVNYPVEYMIFVPVAAMLLTILFDSRLSFYTTIIICFLISAIRGGDYDILIPNFAASLLVIYSVRDVKNRTQIFISMVYILAGYAIAIVATGLERYEDFGLMRNDIYFAALNALLSPILSYGLLIFYEKAFRIPTDLVFLELSDFNHPLLRELSSKAPGTFHHSIVMGNLSEQAAKEIGANQILARVGCYYHDIGKVVTPQYFVENQIDLKGKHGQLNPSLSAKMIIAHVKNGIKLAEKYRLPQEVINFIPMHHGTNLVSYFYEKARTEEGEEDSVHDYIYRYPGPKPHSKETGIVMLADAIEASTRAIEDPTPAKLETQIDEVIKSRFIEGELDECDLTLKDLIKIKYSFLKTLIGIHHHRIKYPEKDEEEE